VDGQSGRVQAPKHLAPNLKTLRDNGTLAYSQISHKTYYKPVDVQKILLVVEEKRKQAKYKGKQI
jgi:hypothetical protein